MLSYMQKDVLREILNTRIGYAASIICEMANQKIYLNVPNVELDKGETISLEYYREYGEITPGNTVLSTINFGNILNGNAFIFFPVDKAKYLVNACLGLDKDVIASKSNRIDLSFDDLDVIKELCNIIFNSILGEFGNMLNVRLNYTVPEVELTTVAERDSDYYIPEDMHVLALYTSFSLKDSVINGVILICLTLNSVKMIINKIDKMIEEVL